MKIASLSVQEIMEAVGGTLLHGSPAPNMPVERIVTDSRSAGMGQGRMFVAIVTRKGNGHDYIERMYRSGVRCFLVSENRGEYASMPEACFIHVPDTLAALQRLASAQRKKFNIPVIAVTGSNGKTVVKEWLSYLLGASRHVVRSPQSYNSQIGVPLSVLQMQAGHEAAVFEAGVSKPGEMEALGEVIRPTFGIFTNIGSAHDAGFPDRNAKIAEKTLLFKHAQTLLWCADYLEIGRQIERQVEAGVLSRQMQKATWTLNSATEADLKVSRLERTQGGTRIHARYLQQDIDIEIPFADKASVENAVHCWLAMLLLGYGNAQIAPLMAHLPIVEMRMEMKEGVGNGFVVNDVYNSDFNSFCVAVDFLCQNAGSRPKCVILSDILQSGRTEEELYAEVAEVLLGKGIDEMVGIGPAMARQKVSFAGIKARFYADTEAFLSDFSLEYYYGKAVLLKGARVFSFERIAAQLQRQVHQTVMEVNLTALVHNINFFRSLIRPQTKLMVMGKAFSYGSGSHEIAGTLVYNHVDYVTVAYPDEAVALRNNGINLPVMCMNPEEEGMETVLRYGIEPVIYNFRTLETLRRCMDGMGLKAKDSVRIHISLDTGMHRMGFEEADLDALISALQAEERCRVQSVFTHLATADMPEMDNYTKAQLERYTRWSERILSAFPYGIMRHCLNTAGIFRFPEYQFDMVRLGIGAYGVGTDEKMQACLETVSTLKTVISQVRTIPAGDAVGYGRRFVAQRETKVGVIGIGYADGLNRHLGNGNGKVWVKGHLVPIIGSICMDMCMIDITGTDIAEKDEVIVFGRENPISNLAEALGTIPYEILTGVSQRVKRVYYRE
ncbi:MAG: bifunctional UDP-N-acetylmuramoyl-tripeptide:D-alanyl-D-alanine ligase/alanine racemase [Bacteroides sp.]|nr:bifunctional UDP-N-acetylmuramoyl-tripeptide:D-alanyl-D-alanine ligase/alanine racemase [Ruminococcus flavefaciens]MCM1554811.1 bifunctional UDP-N-acetylmuramoyl-tripeptide:D-alanyl-D-alanine ligase/alanine racemase [Bacteroides sp.]